MLENLKCLFYILNKKFFSSFVYTIGNNDDKANKARRVGIDNIQLTDNLEIEYVITRWRKRSHFTTV